MGYFIWHLLDNFTLQHFPICVLVSFNAVAAPCSPLFEKESRTL
jgi:hypothetical protein